VVPGVEFEDVVAFLEESRAEGEGVGALLVVGGVVRAGGGGADGGEGCGDTVGVVFGDGLCGVGRWCGC